MYMRYCWKMETDKEVASWLTNKHINALSSPYSSPASRQRIVELSRPKQSRSAWVTSPGPQVMWGTQEQLRPIRDTALVATPTSRVGELAQPKRNFQKGGCINRDLYFYSAGRPSDVWHVRPEALKAEATPRLHDLAKHKEPKEPCNERPHYVFSCGRSSPIWHANKGDEPEQRDRLTTLAQAKQLPKEYSPNRYQPQTLIPPSALQAQPSPRLECLSAAKRRDDGPFRDPIWNVPVSAKKASPTTRLQELSRSKNIVDGYQQAREVVWEPSRSAQRAVPSNRIGELSAPIVRQSMDNVQFDPNAFVVKSTALKGRCSQRVEELAQPLQR